MDDTGDGMQCDSHPYRANPGGICAFCLQEKLGKLVSSKSSAPFFPVPQPHSSSSSSSSPSFPCSVGSGAGGVGGVASASDASLARQHRRSRIPFLYPAHGHVKKKKSSGGGVCGGGAKVTSNAGTSSADGGKFIFKRSKSVAPRPIARVPDGDIVDTPRKRWFWSFLHLSSHHHSSIAGEGDAAKGLKQKHHHQEGGNACSIPNEEAKTPKRDHAAIAAMPPSVTAPAVVPSTVEDVETPRASQANPAFERKVSRSRSVGCGSRSFSGDFLERISTGFGDCALRRVESQREGNKSSSSGAKIVLRRVPGEAEDEDAKRQQRVRCGGIFGGLGMVSSSSYWLPVEFGGFGGCGGRMSTAGCDGSEVVTPRTRAKLWGWAFRPVSRPYPTQGTTSGTLLDVNHRAPSNAAGTASTTTAVVSTSLVAARG